MEKKKLYTLIMAVLMVGSIFGFSFFFTGGSTPNAPPQGNLPPDTTITPPTAIRFQANGVESTVQKLFPAILLTASTNEGEIAIVDSQILGVEGVKRINNSFYRQAVEPSLAGPLVYIAEISIEKDASREEVAQQISGLDFFLDSSVFLVGLVSLPETISLKNEELNLTQEHTFSNPASQAYLNLGTVEGDEILLSLDATLSGTTLQNLIAAEETNLTSAPQLLQLSGEFEILSAQTTLLLSAQMPATQTSTLEELEQRISGLESVSKAGLTFFESSEPIMVFFEEDASLFEEDLETFFTGFEGVQDSEIDVEQKQAEVFAEPEIDFEQFLSGLKGELDSLGFAVKEIVSPKAQVQGEIESTSSELLDLSAQIRPLLEENGLEEISFLQTVQVKADQLVDEQTDTTYAVEEGFFEALVKPGHAVGENISLDVLVIVSRGKISSISATELQEETE